MTDKRLHGIISNLIDWAVMHDQEFLECFIDASGMSDAELKDEFGIDMSDFDED